MRRPRIPASPGAPGKGTLHRAPRASGFTLVEILMVVTIIAFIAGALVIAARNVMMRAKRHATLALIQKLSTACAEFRQDFGYCPPDDWPISTDQECNTQDRTIRATDNPSGVSLRANANMVLRLRYLYPMGQKQYLGEKDLKESEMGGGLTRSYVSANMTLPVALRSAATRFELAYPDQRYPNRGLVVVDAWERPLYYNSNTPDPTRPTQVDVRWSVAGVTATSVPIRNAKGVDIFSGGEDGRTAPNNSIDDDQNGSVDEAAETNFIGEAADDINNWASH